MIAAQKTYSKLYFMLFLLFSVQNISAAQIIKHESTNNNVDLQKSYYLALLQLAIEKAQSKFGELSLQGIGANMVYKRRLKSINSGTIDVMWAMTSVQREIWNVAYTNSYF